MSHNDKPGPHHGDKTIEDLTLLDLFRLPAGRLSDLEVGARVEPEELSALKKAIASHPVPVPWQEAESQIASLLNEALHTSLLTVASSAWKAYGHLMEDAERSRKAPDSPILFPMKEHKIESTLRPYVEVFLGPTKLPDIRFTVTLTTHLRGVLLVLRGGSIVSVSLGDCEWTGEIKLANFSLTHRPLCKVTLPGRVDLKRGIPLGVSEES